MKQWNLSKNGPAGRKYEPNAQRVHPAGVSQFGSAMGNHATGVGDRLGNPARDIYDGRGFMAPGIKSGRHPSGSQKKHG